MDKRRVKVIFFVEDEWMEMEAIAHRLSREEGVNVLLIHSVITR